MTEAPAFEAARARVLAARAEKRAAAAAVGVDEGFIDRLVDAFYADVRRDAVLGPIFEARVGDWPHHLALLKRFWSSVLLSSGSFEGRPMPKHVAIPGIEAAEFAHWLALFRKTLERLARDPAAVELVHARARMIATSLLAGVRQYRDGITDPALLRPVFA